MVIRIVLLAASPSTSYFPNSLLSWTVFLQTVQHSLVFGLLDKPISMRNSVKMGENLGRDPLSGA